MSASPAALFEILEGCFSRVFGKGSFFLVLVSFLWPFAQHCTTWDYYSVEMDPFNDGLLFLRGQLFFYKIRKPLHFEDRDLKNRRCDFQILGPFSWTVLQFFLLSFLCVSLSLWIDLGDPQSFLAHNGPLSSSPQVSASLSHVTINGDSLISGVKGASRMGGFFLSSSNGKEAIGLCN